MSTLARAGNVLWYGSRHILATVVTALAVAFVPGALSIAAGIITTIVGIIMTILLLFGADPPIMGFLFGLLFTLSAILATVIAPLVILVLSLVFSLLVISSLVFIAGRLAESLRLRPGFATSLCYFLAGLLAGGALAAMAYGLALAVEWQAEAKFWIVEVILLICLFTGVGAVFLYRSILLAGDAVRLSLLHLVRCWSLHRSADKNQPALTQTIE